MTHFISRQDRILIEGYLSHSVNSMDDHIRALHDHGKGETSMHDPAKMTNETMATSLPSHNHACILQHHPFAAVPPHQQHSQIPASQAQAPLAQHFGAHSFQHPNQAHPFGQMSARSLQQPQSHHSVLASMDLMLPSSFSSQRSPGNHLSTFGKGSLFQSSSHHTSHTAAAGDLLSMSHRPIESLMKNAKDHTKKRTASYSGRSHMEAMMMMSTNSTPFVTPQQQQQHNAFAWNVGTTGTGLQQIPPSNNSTNRVSIGTSLLSSSSTIVSTTGSWYSQQQEQQDRENDESYQHHRTIRRCRRSDSFEMMDDGC